MLAKKLCAHSVQIKHVTFNFKIFTAKNTPIKNLRKGNIDFRTLCLCLYQIATHLTVCAINTLVNCKLDVVNFLLSERKRIFMQLADRKLDMEDNSLRRISILKLVHKALGFFLFFLGLVIFGVSENGLWDS